MVQEMVSTSSPDRRTRKRDQKRLALLEIAADLFDEGGPDAVTLTAIAERADLATPSMYTYFESKSALLAGLQTEALKVLATEINGHVKGWASDSCPESTSALARLIAFSDLFISAPEMYPREFGLQQQMLIHSGVETPSDAATVVPTALSVLAIPQRLIDSATQHGALRPAVAASDPLANSSIGRTVMWVSALNGILLADSLTIGLPATGKSLGDTLTLDLLVGWGADPGLLPAAQELANNWTNERR